MVLNLPNAVTLFNTVPHAVVTPNHKIISLLLHNCNFVTVRNRDKKYLICYPSLGVVTHKLRTTAAQHVLEEASQFPP